MDSELSSALLIEDLIEDLIGDDDLFGINLALTPTRSSNPRDPVVDSAVGFDKNSVAKCGTVNNSAAPNSTVKDSAGNAGSAAGSAGSAGNTLFELLENLPPPYTYPRLKRKFDKISYKHTRQVNKSSKDQIEHDVYYILQNASSQPISKLTLLKDILGNMNDVVVNDISAFRSEKSPRSEIFRKLYDYLHGMFRFRPFEELTIEDVLIRNRSNKEDKTKTLRTVGDMICYVQYEMTVPAYISKNATRVSQVNETLMKLRNVRNIEVPPEYHWRVVEKRNYKRTGKYKKRPAECAELENFFVD